MSRIQQRNTRPEIMIRSLLHSLGYHFRLHNKKFPPLHLFTYLLDNFHYIPKFTYFASKY
jgi:hypothetical protein